MKDIKKIIRKNRMIDFLGCLILNTTDPEKVIKYEKLIKEIINNE